MDWSLPPSVNDKVDLGSKWQPFPIETFMPKNKDKLLVTSVRCEKAENQLMKILSSNLAKNLIKVRKDFLEMISKVAGQSISTLPVASLLYDTLAIETYDNNFWWSNVWTMEQQLQILDQLKIISDFDFELRWSSKLLQKLRSGILIEQIYENIKGFIDGTSNNRFYEYSAYDSTVAPLLHLIGSFNNKRIMFGSSVIFELHQKNNDYFIKIYYLNSTYTEQPHLLNIGICGGQSSCPYDRFYKSIEEFFILDFEKECGNNNSPSNNNENVQDNYSSSSITINIKNEKSWFKLVFYISFYVILLSSIFYFLILSIKNRTAQKRALYVKL